MWDLFFYAYFFVLYNLKKLQFLNCFECKSGIKFY